MSNFLNGLAQGAGVVTILGALAAAYNFVGRAIVRRDSALLTAYEQSRQIAEAEGEGDEPCHPIGFHNSMEEK